MPLKVPDVIGVAYKKEIVDQIADLLRDGGVKGAVIFSREADNGISSLRQYHLEFTAV